VNAEERKSFFASARFTLPLQSRFRRYLMAIESAKTDSKGNHVFRYRTVKRSIHHPRELREECLRLLPSALYHSVARFGNAKNVGPRARRKLKGKDNYALNQFQGADLPFDIDAKLFGGSLTKAFMFALEIIGWLSERVPHEGLVLVFSGRGWHIHVRNWDDLILESYPRRCGVGPAEAVTDLPCPGLPCPGKEREFIYRVASFKLFKMMRDSGLFINSEIAEDIRKVTTDTRRVIRVVGSRNERAHETVSVFDCAAYLKPFDPYKRQALLDCLRLKRKRPASAGPMAARPSGKSESEASEPSGRLQLSKLELRSPEKQDGNTNHVEFNALVSGPSRAMITSASKDTDASLGQKSRRDRGSRTEADRNESRSAICSQEQKSESLAEKSPGSPLIIKGGSP